MNTSSVSYLYSDMAKLSSSGIYQDVVICTYQKKKMFTAGF